MIRIHAHMVPSSAGSGNDVEPTMGALQPDVEYPVALRVTVEEGNGKQPGILISVFVQFRQVSHSLSPRASESAGALPCGFIIIHDEILHEYSLGNSFPCFNALFHIPIILDGQCDVSIIL